nr:DUF2470 domain-containing protein [Mycobacterium lepraemurium]
MLPWPCPAPSTAERIRSACVHAGGALLAVEHDDPVPTPVHHLIGAGPFACSFALALPVEREHRLQPVAGAAALLELTDYAPLPLREPVRSLVWVRGRLHEVDPAQILETLDVIAAECPNPALLGVDTPRRADGTEPRYVLRPLEIASVVVTDATGAEPVDVAALLAARPDPFCALESDLLWHLDIAHGDVVSRLPAPLRRGQVRPPGLDRYGVRFRVEGNDRDHDVRLPFHKPVDDMTELSQAIRVLMC